MIERAKGIVMERHGLDERAAFERLRDHARAGNRRVVDVAPRSWRATRCCRRPRQGLTHAGDAAVNEARQRTLTAARATGPAPAIEPGDFKRAFQRFQKDQVTDHAAGLTYYTLLSLFPAVLFAVAVLGFFGQQGLIDQAADFLRSVGAPAATIDAVTGALDGAQDNRGTALGGARSSGS